MRLECWCDSTALDTPPRRFNSSRSCNSRSRRSMQVQRQHGMPADQFGEDGERRPSFAWDVGREEVPWMTLYVSVGVWTSLAMVLL